ncbi:uncharacterized protein LOC135076910 [Ostrinia nubilalis]|uniref:uncharacterized protein LOC135076910 n=1 Tax=Ostrinia nubilalis TaxID=29057 RepID=UPI00308240D8
MGQVGSQPAPAHTLPHKPPRHAPKVLPSLPESPRLRSTDNGAILQSGGTISGRRPASTLHDASRVPHGHVQGRRPASTLHDASRVPHGHVHSNIMYRSRSAGAPGEASEQRARERNPLHRSHTNLDLRHNDSSSSLNKRFGSEPDLRIEEEQQKPKCNKHFRKKYRAPPPPTHDNCEGSSPDSSEGNARAEPQRKLRLFKTRNETKKLNGHLDSKPAFRTSSTEYRSLDYNENQTFERRYRSPCKDKEQHYKYPDNKDMVQSSASLKREERILQTKQDYRKTRTDRVSGCRAKTSKTNEQSEAWKTPLLNRNFRYSERFKKEDSEQPSLRREKTFDNTLHVSEKESESPRAIHENRIKAIGEQLKGSHLSPLADNKPLRKSLPSLLMKNNEEKDEFQAELKKATSRIRNELGGKINISENKTSQNDKPSAQKPNPTKLAVQSKVKESSLKPSNVIKPETKSAISRRPLARTNEVKPKTAIPQKTTPNAKSNPIVSKSKFTGKENGRTIPDRGQASGKESTPEHSPTRKKDIATSQTAPEKQKSAPSKQFYFGMIESKQTAPRDHLKDFPGLGSPIIEEISNFHLIEKKLLGYHDEDAEFDKFNAKLKEDCKTKNLSSESALSSDGSEGSGSEGSLGIALRLRPTLPKKQPSMPRFSPAAAWRQLASLDAHLASVQVGLARAPGSLGIALRLRPTLPKKQPSMPRFSPAAAWRQLASLDAHLASVQVGLARAPGSLGIALRLRPTLPKKQPSMPRFSPAAAWRQLASLDAHLASVQVGLARAPGSLGIALRLRPTLPKKQPSMPRFSPAAAWRQLASLDAHLASVQVGLARAPGSLGIALRLRPTLPKKQPSMPRFSPAAAWRQLASLDAHLASETQPLAVETKMSADISAESSPRSEQSADKSGDSGISGDHAHSDHRVDSPRHHTQESSPAAWTPQQDLGDSSSDGAGGGALHVGGPRVATYSPGAQPFSLSLPRDGQDRGKPLQQGFNSLQKLRKSVSGALGAALGSRRFDLEHEPMLQEPEQNWFLTKSAPNSLSNPLLFQQPRAKGSTEEDIKEESIAPSEKDDMAAWRPSNSYLSWGGHVMYLPPAPAAPDQPLSMLAIDRPVRSKSSGCLEAAARAARAALASEMRERERSASPELARALPARVEPVSVTHVKRSARQAVHVPVDGAAAGAEKISGEAVP